MGIKTIDILYKKYLKECEKKKIKPLDYIDFIIEFGL
jgi:hypothetical protein